MIRQALHRLLPWNVFTAAGICAAIAVVSSAGSASKITKIKGDQVLVDLDGESSQYSEGSRYLVMIDGKRKAVVELTKVRGEKAIGKILKGTAAENGTLAPLTTASAATTTPQTTASTSPPQTARRSRSAKSSRSRRSNGGLFSSMTFGGVIGYGIANQNVGTIPVNGKGNTFSLKGFADLPISGDLGVLARAGFENFSVSGSDGAGLTRSTKILYIDADALLKYNFLEGNFKIFPLAGMGLHYPLSKSSDILKVEQISATTIFFFGGGLNYGLSDSMYLHATVEYGFFPPSNDVSTSLIDVRVGAGFAL